MSIRTNVYYKINCDLKGKNKVKNEIEKRDIQISNEVMEKMMKENEQKKRQYKSNTTTISQTINIYRIDGEKERRFLALRTRNLVDLLHSCYYCSISFSLPFFLPC